MDLDLDLDLLGYNFYFRRVVGHYVGLLFFFGLEKFLDLNFFLDVGLEKFLVLTQNYHTILLLILYSSSITVGYGHTH